MLVSSCLLGLGESPKLSERLGALSEEPSVLGAELLPPKPPSRGAELYRQTAFLRSFCQI
jgi:hypothetical protein